MKHIGLFEGIGGFSLAARWMGWETVAWCEWNEFGQRVLRHHFPEAIGHGDITKTDFTPYANTIDILTGGFPCQPYSAAGKRRGKDDDRHLWPEMLRAIREIAPRYVVGENVLGLVNWNGGMVFDEVCADLEAEGYEVTPVVIPAAAVNAPHGRDRVWFVAYSKSSRSTISNLGESETKQQIQTRSDTNGFEGFGPTPDTHSTRRKKWNDNGQRTNQTQTRTGLDDRVKRPCYNGDASDTNSDGLQRCLSSNQYQQQRSEESNVEKCISARRYPISFDNFPTQSPICGGDDGLPSQLDGITFPKWRAESIKAYGNAIVPQVAYQLFKAIEQYETQNTWKTNH